MTERSWFYFHHEL